MANKVFQRSYKFLPEVFQTSLNRKFLNNTMDNLVAPGTTHQLNNYIGRRQSKGSGATDRWLDEPTSSLKSSYQLEVGAASLEADGKYSFGASFEDLILSLQHYGANVSELSKLLRDDFKAADLKIDLDKLINFRQYYWMPQGPESLPISFGEKNYDAIAANIFSSRVLVYIDDNHFYVRTSSIPEHVIDKFPNILNTRELVSKTLKFKFPKAPGSMQLQNQIVVDAGSMVGVALNGLPFYTYTMGTTEQLGATTYTINTPFLDNHVLAFEDYGFDTVGLDGEQENKSEDLLHRSPTAFRGHPDANGIYHYHTYTSVLYNGAATAHSPILGFAFDGFPIYGPYGYAQQDGGGEIVRMQSSYRLRSVDANAEPARNTPDGRYVEDFEYSDSYGTLDENNGRFCITPEFPNGTYAYFLTLDSTGAPAFPYVVGPRYHGSPVKQSGDIGIPTELEVYTRIANFGVNIERDIIGKTQFSIGGLQFTNGLKVSFGADALPKEYANNEYYVEGVGSSIALVPTGNLRLPESYIGTLTDKFDRSSYDITAYEEISANPILPDFIVMKRNDQSCNSWSRINRWFHIDVIEATANYLGKPVLVENTSQAKRPIIEFDANLALYNHGYKNIAFVNVLDSTIVDALSKVQGSTGYTLDGVTLTNGSLVVFANDADPDVRKNVYEVEILYLDEGRATSEFVSIEADVKTISVNGNFSKYTIALKQDERVLRNGTDYTISNATATSGTINLVSALPINTTLEVVFMDMQANVRLKEFAVASDFDSVLVISGASNLGSSYYFKNSNWVLAQNKRKLNSQPLFDLFDGNSVSIGDRVQYQGTTFAGNTLFSYKLGAGTPDTVLNFPVSYSSTSNLADIQFEWNHSNGAFNYVVNGASNQIGTENFYAYDHNTSQYRSMVLSSAHDQSLKVIDVRFIDTDTTLLALSSLFQHSDYQETLFVYVNDKLLTRNNDYDVVEIKTDGILVQQRIKFRTTVTADSKVVFKYLPADSITTQLLTWDVPQSMSINPYNEQITILDLGSISRHYESGVAQVLGFVGNVHGRNNARDLPSIHKLCQGVGYNNGNLLLATALLKNQEFGFIESIEYARDEYTKFKNNLILTYDIGNITYDIEKGIGDLVDSLIQNWQYSKTNGFPFANSDMLPGYNNYTETSYSVKFQQDKTYPLDEIYLDEEESRKAVLVYHNGILLVRGKDYEFNSLLPTVVLSDALTLAEFDTIVIRQYSTTGNNFVPPTPAKLGLADIFEPALITLVMPEGNTLMIRGHDGSLTPAYPGVDNERNDIILDVETRIYNNIKKNTNANALAIRKQLSPLPGAFRNTIDDFINANSIMNRSFGQWILKGGLDFTSNASFTRTNSWTWNYSGQTDKWDNKIPVGHWTGVYEYYFDCYTPDLTPWLMLGFNEEPVWWEEEYGPAPYTKKNTKLWTDLELGLNRNLGTVDARYIRKELQTVIPVDDHGTLLDPCSAGLVKNINPNDPKILAPWQFGDRAPVESAWRRSSESRFAQQEFWAITDPRHYFGIGFDLLDLRIDPVDGLIKIYTPATAINKPIRQVDVRASIAVASEANGYLAWLQGRSTLLNISDDVFATFIKNIEPRLMYKLSGFSDKDKLRFFINSVTPSSKNAMNLMPEDSHQILLDKSAPIDRLVYSGVVVTKTASGWKVEGYDTQNANFYILPSIEPGPNHTVRVGSRPEAFITWTAGTSLVKDQVVKLDNNYYRVISSHTTDVDNIGVNVRLAPLSGLPEVGGIVGIIWDTFDTMPLRVPYGTQFNSIQGVFDFLISYGRFLESRGFIFSQYSADLNEVLNWQTSAKELLYWSTQNWNAGALLTLSPASTGLTMYIPQGEIDGLYAPTSDPRSVLNQSRTPLTANDLDVDRNFDVVTVVPTNSTEKSIYYLSANVRNYDHLVIFDNRTTFNDVVFEPTTGARQERLQVKGFKSNSWTGKFFIPGFTLDQNLIDEWASYTDYLIGDLVKLGETVYQCVTSHKSELLFNYDNFKVTIKQPKLYMQPNLETLVDQIDQYYGLNSEQVVSDASNYARHLIGFQKRDYLEDLLANDETQFKFYQGMITQKGTSEAISKLLRATGNTADIPTVDIKDEWAFRIGEFGLTDNVDEIEVTLNSKDFFFDKTLLDFNNGVFYDRDLVGLTPDNIITTSERVIGSVFPTTAAKYKQKTAGYARIDQVDAVFLSSTDLDNYSSRLMTVDGSVLWIANHVDDNTPRLYRTKKSKTYTFTQLDNDILQLDDTLPFTEGEYVWIYGVDPISGEVDVNYLVGAYVIGAVDTDLNQFLLASGTNTLSKDDVFRGFVVHINDVKLSNFTPTVVGDRLYDTSTGERLWIDSYDGGWAVFKHVDAYSNLINIDVRGQETQQIGTALHTWAYFTAPWLAAQVTMSSDSGYTNQAVAIWERLNDDDSLTQTTEPIRPETTTVGQTSNFGAAINNADRDTLFIGAPGDDSNKGAVLVYARSESGKWTFITKLAGDAGDYLGTSIVRISSTLMLASAPGNSRVYLYTYDGTTWNKTEFTNGGLGYGTKMVIDGTLLAISDTVDNGAVHLYTVNTTTAAKTLLADHAGTVTKPITSFDVYKSGTTLLLAVGSDVGDGAVNLYTVAGTTTLVQELLPFDDTGDRAFGTVVKFTESGKLIVGDPNAASGRATTITSTTFDGNFTTFNDIVNIGALVVYGNYLGNWMFEQQLENPLTKTAAAGSNFGTVIAEAAGNLIVSEPGLSESGDPTTTVKRDIKLWEEQGPGWSRESYQQPVVDMDKVNRALNYNPATGTLINFLPVYDPLSNNHDATALQNIDYIIGIDPSVYQTDSPGSNYWANEKVGKVWWDNRKAYWLDYQQGSDLPYRLKHWGELFPASAIDVCEWIESTVAPALYNANNEFPDMGRPPLGANQPYNIKVVLGPDNLNYSRYYFWAANKQYTETIGGKTMPVGEIARLLILGPDKYVAISGENSVITYNLDNDFVNSRQVLQVELLRSAVDNPPHIEWALLNEGDSVAPPAVLQSKMIDSLTGLDTAGNMVPDPSLSISKQVGTKFRPRQTMFGDRIAAIQTAVEFINDRLAETILVDTNIGTLENKDPVPLKSEYKVTNFDFNNTSFDLNVTTFEEPVTNWDEAFLTYADIIEDELPNKPTGYKILVEADENFFNYWTVYTWSGEMLVLSQIQTYDTTRYWTRTDYYDQVNYTATSVPDDTVNTEQEFINNNYAPDTIVKVLGPGNWRVLKQDATPGESTIVAMQNGTIRITLEKSDFDTSLSFDTVSFDTALFDPQPSIEFRQILLALRDNIFVNERASVWNRLFFRMVRYALVEQIYLDWAIKSSFIKVINSIGSLTERSVYALDTQDSLERYINEIKPYHTKIREYTAVYNRTDPYQSQSTDFDCPPHYDGANPVRSVIYQPNQEFLFQGFMPWRSFADHHRYSIVAVVVVHGGSLYNSLPEISFVGGHDPYNVEENRSATAMAAIGSGKQSYTSIGDGYFDFRRVWRQRQADADSTINADDVLQDLVGSGPYAVTRIEIDEPGAGYITAPEVVITGGGGNGARAYAVLGDTKQRMFRMGMKFDRIKGTSDILPADLKDYSAVIPGFNEWHAADRIHAYYAPDANIGFGLPEESRKTYVGDGVTDEFDCPLDFNYAEQIRVSVNSAIVTNYTVHETSKTIEFTTAPASNADIVIALVNPLLPFLRGADFDRTKILGTTFNSGPGFDSQGKGFDSVQFDNWDLDPSGNYVELGGYDTYLSGGKFNSSMGVDPTEIIRVFTADGATTDLNLKFTPPDVDTLLVKVGNDVKLVTDDFTVNNNILSFNVAPAAGKIITIARVIKVIKGNGTNKTYDLAEEITTARALSITVDGEYLVPNVDFTVATDTITLTTAPALGTSVVIENVASSIASGGAFLSPETTPSTEECLSGQIFDTVDIKVYSHPIAGANAIGIAAWTGNGSTTRFALTELPNTPQHLTVFVNGLVQNPSNISVDYITEEVVFSTAPTNASIITAVVVNDQGIKVHQVQNFIGDSTTGVFRVVNADLTSTLADTNRTTIVLVNGVKATHTVTKNNSDLVFTLSPVPATNARIKIIVYEASQSAASFDMDTYDVTSFDPQLPGGKRYTESFNQVITLSPAVGAYSIDNQGGPLAPITASTVCHIIAGPANVGQRLRPADTAYYAGDSSTSTFSLPNNPVVDYTGYLESDISVSVDGYILDSTSFVMNNAAKTVALDITPATDSVVTVTNFKNCDYYVRDDALFFNSSVNFNGTQVLVSTLNDSGVVGFRTEVFQGTQMITLNYGVGVGAFGAAPWGATISTTVNADSIILSKPLINVNQAQVYVNGIYKVVGKDWILKSGSLTNITIAGGVSESDVVVVHYTTGGRARAATGFRVFKDMIGRVNYYRINEENSTRLSQSLEIDDTKIYVYNIDALPDPDIDANKPGVIMINKERIEYWTKTDTYITDLRRGTHGTGASALHTKGELVIDKHYRNAVPSTDLVHKIAFASDGVTTQFALPVSLPVTTVSAVTVYVGGRRNTSWTQDGAKITFATAPRTGMTIHIVIKQGKTWYDLADGVTSLQNLNTPQARFIRDKAAVFDL